MRDLDVLFIHFIATLARLLGPGGARSIVAESLLVKHQLHEPSTENQEPLGSPPSYLSKDEKKVWKDLAKQLLPGVAFASDRTAFELLTRLTAKMRAGKMEKSSDMTTLISLFSRFAMTPADRSRVAVEKKQESGLQAFLNRRKTLDSLQ